MRLSVLPPLVVSLVMLGLMLVGMLAPLWLALSAFAVVAVFVSWLAVLSWPVLDTRGKLLRCLLLGLVIGAATGRLRGWL